MATCMDKKNVRALASGCYDLFHYGHANQLLQAKQVSDYLVAGVDSHKAIAAYKRPPVIDERERRQIVGAIRWVDEIIENVDYFVTADTLDALNCDVFVHGNDIIAAPDGTDAYSALREAGRYIECERTQGISTTDIIGRMFSQTTGHHSFSGFMQPEHVILARRLASCRLGKTPWVTLYHYDDSNEVPKIDILIPGHEKRPANKVVYVDGDFDLFHVGHLRFLEKAASMGDYLIVGIHSDQLSNKYAGKSYPVLSMHERVLTILGIKYIDALLVNAPYTISHELMFFLQIDLVLHNESLIVLDPKSMDRFKVPQQQNKFRRIDTVNDISTGLIIMRVISRRMQNKDPNNKMSDTSDRLNVMVENA